MRTSMWKVVGMLLLLMLMSLPSGLAHAIAPEVGRPHVIGVRGLELRMRRNRELAAYVEARGYPDWVEEVEVDTWPPLSTHEIRLYYLRMDREIAFTEAFVLGRPDIGLRLYEIPIDPATRQRIELIYLAHDPVRRAELAANRAVGAAERAEHAADLVESAADRAERIVDEMERFPRRKPRR